MLTDRRPKPRKRCLPCRKQSRSFNGLGRCRCPPSVPFINNDPFDTPYTPYHRNIIPAFIVVLTVFSARYPFCFEKPGTCRRNIFGPWATYGLQFLGSRLPRASSIRTSRIINGLDSSFLHLFRRRRLPFPLFVMTRSPSFGLHARVDRWWIYIKYFTKSNAILVVLLASSKVDSMPLTMPT